MCRVAVFFGGISPEREISVLTGVFVLNVLDRQKYEILPVYVGADGRFYTSDSMFNLEAFKKGKAAFRPIFFDGGNAYAWDKKGKKATRLGKVDVALNCCHGGVGEGGLISALAKAQGWACASPGTAASGLFMSKSTTKFLAKGLGIPVVDYVRVSEKDYRKRGKYLLKTVALRLKYPVIVKPDGLGSSIGVCIANDEKELASALDTAFTLDGVAIVEKLVQGKKDVNCAAYLLQGEVILSEAEVASADEGVYDFEKKYLSGGDFLKGGGRAVLGGKYREKIREYTKLLYRRLGLCGVIRADYLLGEDGSIYLSEINAVPGSLAYYLFCEKLSDARLFFGDLIEEGRLQKAREEKQIPSTGVLSTLSLRK